MAGSTGTPGNSLNLLRNPYDIYVDANYTMYIVDNGNHRVQKWVRGKLSSICEIGLICAGWSLGAVSGETVAGQTGIAGSWSYLLNSPTSITLDQFGHLYIMDSGNNRIQRWWPGSTYGVTVLSGSFWNPRGIVFDPFGNLVIADQSYHRIVLSSIVCRK